MLMKNCEDKKGILFSKIICQMFYYYLNDRKNMKGRNYMDQIKSFMPDKIKKGQKIIIYGAGRYGELALRGLQHLSLQPSFFVDRSLAGTMYLGINVIAPKELENYKNDIVLIASYNYFNEMLEILQTTGIKYYYDILELLKIEYDEN